MYKYLILLACLTYLCLNVSTGTDIPKSKLKSAARSFQQIIRKNNLTCGNYESFCDGPKSEILKPASYCKEWLSVLVCKNGTMEELRAAANKITQKLEKHLHGETL